MSQPVDMVGLNLFVDGITTSTTSITPGKSLSVTQTNLTGTPLKGNASGATGTADYTHNRILVLNDTVDPSNFSGGQVDALGVSVIPGQNTKGNRSAMAGTLFMPLSTNLAPPGGNYLGGSFIAQSNANLGGSAVDGKGHASGAVFGIGSNGILDGGATNILNVTAAEFDVSVTSSCTVLAKSGISIAQLPGDAVHGAIYDAGVSISRQPSSSGWLNGILFSDYNGAQPCASSGQLIATQGSSTITNGINFSSYTFTGAPIIMPLQTPSSSSATGVAGSMCWDTGFVYVCTATNTWKRAALSTF